MTSVYNYPSQSQLKLARNRSLSTGTLKQFGTSQVSLGLYGESHAMSPQTQPHVTNYINYSDDLNARQSIYASSKKYDPQLESKLTLTAAFSTKPNSPSPISGLENFETDIYGRRTSRTQHISPAAESKSRPGRLRSHSCASNNRYMSPSSLPAPIHNSSKQGISFGNNESGFDSCDSDIASYNYNRTNGPGYYVPPRTPLSLGSSPASPPSHNPLLSSSYNPNAYRFQYNKSAGLEQSPMQQQTEYASLSRPKKSEERLRKTLGINNSEIPVISPTVTSSSLNLAKNPTGGNASTDYFPEFTPQTRPRKLSDGFNLLEKLKNVSVDKSERTKKKHKKGKKSTEVVTTKRSMVLLSETVDLQQTDTLINAEPDQMLWPIEIQPPISGVQKLMELY